MFFIIVYDFQLCSNHKMYKTLSNKR